MANRRNSVSEDKIYKSDQSENAQVQSSNIPKPVLSLSTVDVKGIGPVDALIDSGANMCAISKELLTESMVSRMKKFSICSTATVGDNSKIKFEGCVDLCVTYLGETAELSFYVVAELFAPMVLGANWIMKSRAILQSDGTELGVTFGAKKNKVFWSKWFCPRPHVSIDVDGIGLVKGLVDTGADSSCIRRDLLTDLQISQATPSSEIVFVGNGNLVEIESLVDLTVTHQGVATCIENVRIVSNMSDPFILGLDWIYQTRVVIQSNGWNVIASQPDLPPKQKRSGRLTNWLSKKWSSTFGSINKMSSLVSNLSL